MLLDDCCAIIISIVTYYNSAMLVYTVDSLNFCYVIAALPYCQHYNKSSCVCGGGGGGAKGVFVQYGTCYCDQFHELMESLI